MKNKLGALFLLAILAVASSCGGSQKTETTESTTPAKDSTAVQTDTTAHAADSVQAK